MKYLFAVGLLLTATPLYAAPIVVFSTPSGPPAGAELGVTFTFPSGGLESTGPFGVTAFGDSITSVIVDLEDPYTWDAMINESGTDETATFLSPDSLNDGIRTQIASWTYVGLDVGETSLITSDPDFLLGDVLLDYNAVFPGANVSVLFDGGGTIEFVVPDSVTNGFSAYSTTASVPEPTGLLIAAIVAPFALLRRRRR